MWNFHTGALEQDHAVGAAVTVLAIHRESDLVACAADDLRLRMVDLDTAKIVRIFAGHRNRITDLVRHPPGMIDMVGFPNADRYIFFFSEAFGWLRRSPQMHGGSYRRASTRRCGCGTYRRRRAWM